MAERSRYRSSQRWRTTRCPSAACVCFTSSGAFGRCASTRGKKLFRKNFIARDRPRRRTSTITWPGSRGNGNVLRTQGRARGRKSVRSASPAALGLTDTLGRDGARGGSWSSGTPSRSA
eukprot:6444279-Prymnesium_polylepis.1